MGGRRVGRLQMAVIYLVCKYVRRCGDCVVKLSSVLLVLFVCLFLD